MSEVATEQAESESTTSEVSDAEKEIGAAIDAVVASSDKEPKAQDTPPPTDEGRGDTDASQGDEVPAAGEGEQKPKETPKPTISDEALERAIRAGIPLSEVKQYPNEALLTAQCARIEGLSKGEAGSREDAGGENGEGGEALPATGADLLSGIPDLDPDLYDEKVVAGFVAMKEILKRQQEMIVQQQEAIAASQGNRSKEWFAERLEGVKDYTKGDPVRIREVREQFDVLKAGYKAAKKDVTDETIFDQAAKLALGADMEAAKLEEKGKAAKKRSGQLLSRSSKRPVAEKGSVEQETAEMIDRMIASS